MSEEEAPAAPLPSWTSHLAVLSSPQGYDTAALLKELAGDAFPAITVLDAAALAAAAEGAKDSEAGTAIKAFKAQHAGAPLPGTLLAPLIASKLEELKAAGLVARDAAAAAAAAAAEAHAAAVAAAKEASEEPPPAPPPAPAPGPADVYCVLTGFGSGPADYAGLAPLGLGIDSAVWLAVTSGALREAAGGTYEPPPPAEGQEEPGVAEAPNTEARRDAAAEAIASLAGAHGSGLKHCACVSLAIERPPPPADGEEPAAAGWGVPAAVAAKVAELLSAMAAKRAMYDAYIGACFVVDVPVAPAALPDTRVYASLANTSPLHAQGVPFLLDCLLSQVVHSASTDEQAASYLVEQEISTISDYLSSQLAALSGPTKSAAQVAADEAAQSAERPRLVPAADESLARALCSSPYAVAQSSVAKALEREKALLSGLPVPGKGRNGIPAEPALSADERGVERTELHHFSKFSPAQVDGSMQLRALAALVNGADAHRAGQPQPPPSKAAGWLLADRPWSDELDASELCQRLVALRAAAAHPEMLTAYHARDDALLLAFHLPVPESRQAVDSRRLAMYNKTYRPFGAWHEWLMRGLPAWRVPAPPVPPLDGCLYRFAPSFDMARVEALTTTTSLFPTDHTVIRFNPTADGNRLTLSYHDGVHGALTRPPPVFDPDSDEPPAAPAASLALSLAGGTRVLAGACDGGFGVRVGGVDGLELQMDCTGVAHLTPPPPADEPAPVEPPSTAALLKLSRISASGVPTNADAGSGTDPYIKVTLLEHDEDDITVQTTPLMNGAEDGHSAWDDVLFLTLPDSAPRPPLIRLELFDKDFNKPDDLLATGELRIPTALGGQLAEVELLLPKGQKVLVSLTYSVVLGDPTSEVVPAKPAPLPYEVGRRVLPSGTVVRRLSDGALQALYRNANVSMLTPSGDMAGCWVHTNAAGLRVGVRPTGQEFYLPPLALASSTDPVTGCIVTTRSDGILVLTRADGSRLVTFACGTSLAMTADAEKYAGRGEVSVSAPGYPTVRLNLRQRSVLLATPDGAALSSADGTVRLSHPSGVSLQLAQSGLVELLPAALSTLEEVPNTGAGIHYISLPDGSFRLKDAEGSSFAVDLGGRVEVDIVMKDELAGAGADDDAPQPIGGGDEPEWSHPPRLFVCRPDGSGVELLRDADVALFEACRKGDASCSVVQEPLPSDPEAVSHCYTWRPWQLMEALRRQADDDESEAKALIGFMPRVEERPPVAPVLFFRRLVRREPLGVADRCTLERELREMEEWRLQEEQRAKALHVRDTRSAEVIAAEADIQRQLLQVRTLLRFAASRSACQTGGEVRVGRRWGKRGRTRRRDVQQPVGGRARWAFLRLGVPGGAMSPGPPDPEDPALTPGTAPFAHLRNGNGWGSAVASLPHEQRRSLH